MKIKQDFMSICERCPNINPDVSMEVFYVGNIRHHEAITVYCKNKVLCKTLLSYLKTQEEK